MNALVERLNAASDEYEVRKIEKLWDQSGRPEIALRKALGIHPFLNERLDMPEKKLGEKPH